MRGRDGFSLVEALLACALLGAALVPVLSAFRAHVAAADRLACRRRVEARLEERLSQAAIRRAAGVNGQAPSGFIDGLEVYEAEPERMPLGAWSLWRVQVRVRAPKEEVARSGERWLLVPPAPAKEVP